MTGRIVGTLLPVLELTLDEGETVVAEAGRLSWMSAGMRMQTTLFGQGGLLGAFRRAVAGAGWFWTAYTGPGRLAFSAALPGQIVEVPLSPRQPVLVHARGFLAGTSGVRVSVGFQRRLGAGLFGGDGFVLQKIEGTGTAWIELAGQVVPYDLEEDEKLWVHPGHVGMFESRVGFSIRLVRGVRNLLFGDEGLFFAELRGPGRVWCQSTPLPQLAAALEPYLVRDAQDGGRHGR
ncbi:MAG: TIGR00266 family protein [Actinomycetia bacterium]|nr:TIGR00266 family protein [Actinomycetes bacterium]